MKTTPKMMMTPKINTNPKMKTRGAKRDGAWEHCSQKEMDINNLCRRIEANFIALVTILIKNWLFIIPLQLAQ